VTLSQRLLSPFAEVRAHESGTALLMFVCSFCAMAGYNVIRPITRSAFIKDLGADNLPWMPLVTAFLIAGLMGGYAWLVLRLPRRWGLPLTQAGMAALLVTFWFLFRTQGWWVAAAFYVWGQLMGILLISQFWTLANVLYDARQAKRLFGLIGAGAPLGGAAGAWLATKAQLLGTFNLMLYSAAIMLVSAAAVAVVLGREKASEAVAGEAAKTEKGVGVGEALRLLRQSKHLQVIALVIMFAAIGAQILDQQLNMATEAAKGRGELDAITAFLARVGLWMSVAAFFIQVLLTSRIHRLLGIGFALFILPVGLGSTALLVLLNGALWTSGLARVLDQSLRYTVDKTTREVLFLPLPSDLKLKAKPFVDVTVDRFGKAVSALLLLVLVQDWGLALNWQQVSYASLAIVSLWVFAAGRAKKGYLSAFRRSIERRDVKPAEVRIETGDLATIETLVEALAHPDEARVLYAIDLLESLDKRNLVTPLLLYHESPAVRARALRALGGVRPDVAARWLPSVERMLGDDAAEVRAAAVGAIAAIRGETAADLARPLIADKDPRIACTAAVVLAASGRDRDVADAEDTLLRLIADARPSAAAARRDVAAALGRLSHPRLRPLLIPLLYDADPAVAEEALRTARAAGASDFLFVPTLIALLRNRRLKSAARDVLVSYGEPVLDALNHFLRDPDEDVWVRRHLPATIARFDSQRAVDILVDALAEPDGFLRYKAVAGLERLRQGRAALTFRREPIEALALREGRRYFAYLTLHHNLFVRASVARDSLLAHALAEKIGRTLDRVYRLLALIHPWKDIAAARWALERGDARARSSASEYLDNVLTGALRKRVLPVVEDLPIDEKIRRGHVLLRSRPRDVEESLLELINDDDQVVSAAAIDLVRELQVWTLAEDVEHVLAHRDVRDWHVFEAASWTLAARRVGEARRRDLWLEPMPTVEIAARLRVLPLFASVWVDELFRIAGAGRQTRHDGGRVLLQEEAVPEAAHILLEGTCVARGHAVHQREIEAPAPLGFEEVLEGRPMEETVRTSDTCVTLSLSADELQTLLADNTDLVEGLFRTLADAGGRLPSDARAVLRPAAGPAPADLQTLTAGGLTAVEKVLVLQALPIFSRASAEEMVHVASIAREIKLEHGASLAAEGDAASIIAVIAGELAVEPPPQDPRDPGPRAQPLSAGPGDIVGVYETMAGLPYGRSVHATRGGAALRIDRGDLFDLLGQRPALLQQIFGALFRTIGSTGVGPTVRSMDR
jgi:AAA family ATP:ADP antiporter